MTAADLWNVFFGRRRRGAESRRRDDPWSVATGLTLGRAAVSSAVLTVAIVEQSHSLLLLGLGISMVLDVADGLIARRLDGETIFGAQLDGMADRLAVVLVIVGLVSMDDSTAIALAATAVALQFCGIDLYLTFQFLRPGIWSPDHYYVINERVWRRNWSAAAKLASNMPIVLLAVGLWPGALALSVILFAWRLPSCVEVLRDGRKLPELNLCVRHRELIEEEPVERPAPAHPQLQRPAAPARAYTAVH